MGGQIRILGRRQQARRHTEVPLICALTTRGKECYLCLAAFDSLLYEKAERRTCMLDGTVYVLDILIMVFVSIVDFGVKKLA